MDEYEPDYEGYPTDVPGWAYPVRLDDGSTVQANGRPFSDRINYVKAKGNWSDPVTADPIGDIIATMEKLRPKGSRTHA